MPYPLTLTYTHTHTHTFPYSQVSNQCMALVRDDCLVPTLDAPELGYIRESTPEQYVPDVFYKVHVNTSICSSCVSDQTSLGIRREL